MVRPKNQQTFSPDNIGQSSGRNFGKNDGGSPDSIEDGKLGYGQAEIKEQNGKDWVVES